MRTALSAASPSLRAEGEAIYPSTNALLDGFAQLAVMLSVRERKKPSKCLDLEGSYDVMRP